PRVATQNTHGTGCTLSSAVAAGLAKGYGLAEAARRAKDYVTAAIAAADKLAIGTGNGPIHHFHRWWSTSATPTEQTMSPHLTRRRLVQTGALASAGAIAAPSIARAQAKRWRMVTSWPKRLPGPGMSAERVAQRIKALSGGKLEITVHGAGEVVPALE